MNNKTTKAIPLRIITIIMAIIACVATGSYLLYNYYYQSEAEESSRSINFGTTSGDYFMNEMGITLKDIGDTTLVDELLGTFGNLPIFIRIENPTVSIVDHANFAKIQERGHFWYFSATTYADLRSIATAYFAKYPDGKAILELTDQNARSDTETQALAASFPRSRFVAANHMNWDREKTKELVNISVSNHLTYPSLYGVSFFIDATEGLDDISENIALFWDMIFDASSDIAGTSVAVGWPHKNFNLALSEIKVAPRTSPSDILKDEARRLGIFVTVFYNYVQKKGDDNRTGNNNIPIKYSGLGEYASLTPNAKKIAAVFAMISKYKMAGVYPATSAGLNLRDHKPLFGIVGYSPDAGHALVFSNASGSEMTIKLPGSFASTSYSSVSTVRGSEFVIDGNNHIVMRPYEVVAVYKTGSLDLPDITISPTSATTGEPTISPTSGQNTTPTATRAMTASPTLSLTPTHSLTPTRTPTTISTPSITPTRTSTPTLAPTRVLAAYCDPKGCGVCGWRDTSDVCHADGPMPDSRKCCFSTCISNSCKYVPGYGADKCASDSACVGAPPQQTAITSPLAQTSVSPVISSSALVTQKVQSGVVQITKTGSSPIPTVTPPVSGNSYPLYLLIVPAVIIIIAAIVI